MKFLQAVSTHGATTITGIAMLVVAAKILLADPTRITDPAVSALVVGGLQGIFGADATKTPPAAPAV